MRVRAIAAVTACWLVVCGVLAGHHEATVVHVRNSLGGYVHGTALAERHSGNQSDIHRQRDPNSADDDCALLTASHQAACPRVTPPALTGIDGISLAQHAPCESRPMVSAAIYRLAPKTSPPVVA